MSYQPVVIISGVASGMGRATARLLADSGYIAEGCGAVQLLIRARRADTAISAVPA